MPAPDYTTADFLTAYQGLLPTGSIWPREPDAVLTQTLSALSEGYATQAARSANLLVDAFPATTVELLPQWELSLGLPDPCTGPLPTVGMNQIAIVARLAGVQGSTINDFLALAGLLGYVPQYTAAIPAKAGATTAGKPDFGPAWGTPTAVGGQLGVIQYTPASAGHAVAGDPDLGPNWAFAWQIRLPATQTQLSRAGSARAGDPLGFYGNKSLECLLQQYAPAHTVLRISYGVSGLIWGQGVWGASYWGIE